MRPSSQGDRPPSYRRLPPQLPMSTWLWMGLFVLLTVAFLILILGRTAPAWSGVRQENAVGLIQRLLRRATPENNEMFTETAQTTAVERLPARLIRAAEVYGGPGIQYPKLAVLEASANVEVTAKTEDGQWLRIYLPYLQPAEGWILSGDVELPVDALVPTVEPDSIPPPPTPTAPMYELTAFVNVNIRSGPGLNYEKIATLKQGESIQALGIDPEGFWWAVRVPETGEIGWVSVDYVVGVDKEDVPVISPGDIAGTMIIPTPAEGTPTLVAKFTVNIRSGPGVEFEVIAQLIAGQEAEIVGVSSDGQWWAIKLQGGSREFGWVSILYVEVQNAESVPVIQG